MAARMYTPPMKSTGESIVTNIPDALVFIMGANVSNWVMSSEVTLTTEDMNHANIVLSNPNKMFTITKENKAGNFKAGTSYNDYDRIHSNELVKKQILEYKEKNQETDNMGSKKYPMLPETLVFDEMDTVRIFFKYPWVTGTKGSTINNSEQCWYPAFTGYVTNIDFDLVPDDGLDTASVTLEAKDARYMLNKMRTIQNPMALPGAAALNNEQAYMDSMFADLIAPDSAAWNNAIPNKTPVGFLNMVLLGKFTDAFGKSYGKGDEKRRFGYINDTIEEVKKIIYSIIGI